MATTYSSKPPSMPSAPSVGSRPSVSTTAPSTRPRARPTTATPVSQERGRGSVYSGLGSRPASQDNRDDDNKNKSFFERLRDTWRNSGGKDNDNLKDPREPKPMSIAPRERDEDGSSVYTSDAFTVQPSSTRVKPLPALPEVEVEELEPDTESTQLAIRKATEQTLGIMQIQEYLDKIKKEQEKTELKTPDFVVETPKEETAKKGLMAKPYDPDRMKDINEPLGDRLESVSDKVYRDFIEGNEEGEVAHVGLDNKNITLAGGVVPDGLKYNNTDFTQGASAVNNFDVTKLDTSGAYKKVGNVTVKRSDYDSDKAFAKGVIEEFTKQAKEAASGSWDLMTDDSKKAVVKIGWNKGAGWYGGTSAKAIYKELSKNNPNAENLYSKVLAGSTVKGGGASIGIAKARANAWNETISATKGKEIVKIVADNSGNNTAFKYYDKDNNLLYTEQTSRSSSAYENKITEIKKDSKGVW